MCTQTVLDPLWPQSCPGQGQSPPRRERCNDGGMAVAKDEGTMALGLLADLCKEVREAAPFGATYKAAMNPNDRLECLVDCEGGGHISVLYVPEDARRKTRGSFEMSIKRLL